MAILVYVALDLSLPAMPGAFVFEPADSVDSIGGGRVAVRVVVLHAPAGNAVLPSTELHCGSPHRLRVSREGRPGGCLVVHRLLRVACDPSQPSEDPH
ncbi:MAG TPA: hypothetical protein VN646_06820 [Candidatus Acidoferrum sp.]|nr:hypothetical protein [Candidatus Acidoferrum sp.]